MNNANSNFPSLINRYNYFKFNDYDLDNSKLVDTISSDYDQNIHVYSFCLDPADYKLSGFVSTNKFNKVVLEVDVNNTSGNNLELCIYQVKHNIMRIENGILNILFN